MFNLTDKAAVVTGAASGIGAAIARRLAEAGAHVWVADRDAAGGAAVVAAISEGGGLAEFLSLDVSDEGACQAAARHVLDAPGGRCDILVNNAGIGHVGTALTTSGDDLDRLMAVNVKGVLFLSQAFLPAMVARRSGSIVNLASIGGIVGIRDRLAYCATKFAVVGLTKCMALDHAGSQVRVNCICPGRVETPFMQARISEYPDPEAARAEMTATQALKRMGMPDEIAAAALYLASDEAAFVTGSSLIIDGGWSAGK
jgi:NAD(P)-dependent dehydrogenase (short-subunit alcohol dehydrogenase family)